MCEREARKCIHVVLLARPHGLIVDEKGSKYPLRVPHPPNSKFQNGQTKVVIFLVAREHVINVPDGNVGRARCQLFEYALAHTLEPCDSVATSCASCCLLPSSMVVPLTSKCGNASPELKQAVNANERAHALP